MRIQSHHDPCLYLKSHLKQVWLAAQFLFDGHSLLTCNRRPESAKVLKGMVFGHDLGKSGPAFQVYIADPLNYKGDPREKAHACLSAAIALVWAKHEEWTPLQALALAQAVAGHHSGFISLDGLLEDRLRRDEELMQNQWEQIDYQQLSVETGLSLTNLTGTYRDGRVWLASQQRRKLLLTSLNQAEQVKFRLWVEFLFSILLEADKAFLALRKEKVKEYLSPSRSVLLPSLVDEYLDNISTLAINEIRNQVRATVAQNLLTSLESANPPNLFTVTLPTGMGKTMIAAEWALVMKQRMTQKNAGRTPQIIIVLPYLSIIDQTVKVYRQLLQIDQQTNGQNELLMASHSLSERTYNLEGEDRSQTFADFFIDTWRSEVIVTTFDQLLMAIFSSKTKHLMRFHHLMDALIIFDEVQTLPCRLWHPVGAVLAALCQEGNSQVLMMSATQPGILLNATELVGTPAIITEIFKKFGRYKIVLDHLHSRSISDFALELELRVPEWLNNKSRVLITLNTRASARNIWRQLSIAVEGAIPVLLISADVTPKDRLAKIAEIKTGNPCIVVSTQCIEAGVDIDMDYVIRDFAPLDALIQIAGRCNRNDTQTRGVVEIVQLKSDKGRCYGEMIYDNVHLSVTYQVLANCTEIAEEEILDFVEKYFQLLKESKDLGQDLTKVFAEWEDDIDIRTELRGKQTQQIDFLILHTEKEENQQSLHAAIEAALKERDRWQRRAKLRALSAEIQQRTVSVYAQKLHPEDYASSLGRGKIPYFWLLNEKFYTSEAGLDLLKDEEDSICII